MLSKRALLSRLGCLQVVDLFGYHAHAVSRDMSAHIIAVISIPPVRAFMPLDSPASGFAPP